MSLGKTLFENEQEGFMNPSMESNKSRRNSIKKNSPNKLAPAHYMKNENSIDFLLNQIWIRLRPSWTSIKYRLNLVFAKGNLIRASILLCLGYFVLFYSNNEEVPIQVERVESASLLNISMPEKKTKSNKIQKVKNDAAPVDSKELAIFDADKYIKKFAKIAKSEQKKHGIPASISLAQGLIESRAGTSKLAVNNNNHFGMKCFSKNCNKGHCTNHTDDTHKDFFRKYPDSIESWKDHSRMLSQGRYAKLKKYGSDYRKWAYGLKSIGYATDKSYAEKLIGVIEKYKLNQYD